jgi:hypothetical protein
MLKLTVPGNAAGWQLALLPAPWDCQVVGIVNPSSVTTRNLMTSKPHNLTTSLVKAK